MSDAAPDRYVVRPAEGGLWAVWDTRTGQPVAGGEGLTENAARDIARRFNEAYRRSRRDQSR